MADKKVYCYENVEQRFIKKAEKELHENPQQVHCHIESLRRWLNSMRHIKNCRQDDQFFLRFLRCSKFDHNRAQTMLDNFLTIRKSEKGSTEWFQDPEPQFLEAYLNLGFLVPLGQTDSGELVLMVSYGNWDPETFPFLQLVRCAYAVMDFIISKEEVQICGAITLMNMSSLNKSQMSHWESPKTMFTMMRNWQDAYPIRTKAAIYWNSPFIFDIMYNFLKSAPFLKKKFKDRLHKCGTDVKKLHSLLGSNAKTLLPTEFGGVVVFDQEKKDLFKKEILEGVLKERSLLSSLQIDESLRPPATKGFLKMFDEKLVDGSTGVAGTYTKFDV